MNKVTVIKKRNRVNTTTGYKGVTINSRKPGTYNAFLCFNTPGKKTVNIFLGYFDKPDEAYSARTKYILSLI